jgi:acetyl-CoA synthetase
MEVFMTDVKLKDIYPVPEEFKKNAYIKSYDEYKALWQESIDDPDGFWGRVAEEQVTWFKKWDKVADFNYGKSVDDHYINWFTNAKLNISYNCLDRHLETRGDKTAIIWEGNDPNESKQYTYKELHAEVCKFANVLKANGIKKGDVVTFYLPMIPELAIGILACSRIGAIHAVVFGGFSADALANRINNCESVMVVSCDGTFRGAKAVPQKANADAALKNCTTIKKHLVVERVGADKVTVDWNEDTDVWYHEEVANVSADCPAEELDAEDPLFILYTSGSTGTPKGVMHTTGGYLVYTSFTHKMIFDYHEDDVYWCTADIGWVTGHSYIVYGPLCNGATTIMFEGVPNYPDWGRFWSVVEKYKVNIFYTAPTAIRAIAKEGDSWVENYDISSLRLLGSVGEPINPEAWNWYHNVIGKGKCPIVDTWWQTETGGIMISPQPYAIDQKPGSATLPFFSVKPVLLNEEGEELEGACDGILALKEPWPGQMRTVYNNHERFEKVYFQMFDGYYFAGDGCRRDEDGYFWITGRVDDVINVSGHRMGTAEVESALVSHKEVAEAAVIGYPHDIKGQGIYAFVTLKVSSTPSDELLAELKTHVRKEIGPIATPDVINFAPALPKTRSGKIMRRILRKIATDEFDQLGDISTLADPDVVDNLIDSHKELTSN